METVGIGVVDFCAVDFTDESFIVPVEVVDARACFERGLFGGVDVDDAGAISSALMNLIDPQVVDSTIASIFPFSRGATRIPHRVAVDLTRVVEPVHVLDT